MKACQNTHGRGNPALFAEHTTCERITIRTLFVQRAADSANARNSELRVAPAWLYLGQSPP